MSSRNYSSSDGCSANCSGHGDCVNGTCFCLVQFEGAECSEPNVGYHVAFATVFLLVAATSLLQFFFCVHSEYAQLKNPSLRQAFRVTTQKLLYLFIFAAALLRGLYFAYPATSDQWSTNLSSAYYPVLLSGASLVVCIWAEVFHLKDIVPRKPFLSKSLLGFLAFNIVTYSLLITELVLVNVASFSAEERNFYSTVFNGCYALLMLVVVVFFLAYGIQVYFKVHGGFLNDQRKLQGRNKRTLTAGDLLEDQVKEIYKSTTVTRAVDRCQLQQSRIGLLSQAALLFFTVGFLLSDVLGPLWKYKVPLESRNLHDIVFRIVEFGVALWFPCVLWNCVKPERLWILNPRRIFRRLEEEDQGFFGEAAEALIQSNVSGHPVDRGPECWICYDSERMDAGPMIQPCLCRGDVGVVHHDCLRRWLVESASNPSALACKVCRSPYHVRRADILHWDQLGSALTPRRWVQTAVIICFMASSSVGAILVLHWYQHSGIRLFAASSALLILYICFRFLGVNVDLACRRTRIAGFRILNGQRRASVSAAVTTVSQLVTVEPLPN